MKIHFLSGLSGKAADEAVENVALLDRSRLVVVIRQFDAVVDPSVGVGQPDIRSDSLIYLLHRLEYLYTLNIFYRENQT